MFCSYIGLNHKAVCYHMQIELMGSFAKIVKTECHCTCVINFRDQIKFIKFFTVNTKLAEMALLASNDLTTAK